MTKSDLVSLIARSQEIPAAHAKILVEMFLDGLIDVIAGPQRVEMRGFGTFGVRQRRGRVGRNPRTGHRVSVPAKRVPYFKPGRVLKQALNLEGRSAKK